MRRETTACNTCGGPRSSVRPGLCKKCYDAERNRVKADEIAVQKKAYYQLNKSRISLHTKNYRQNGKKNGVRTTDIKGHQYWRYNNSKYVHTAIAEKALERKLKSSECVHHIDGNGLNNKHSNLVICTRSHHAWFHNQRRSKDEKKT